MLEETPHLSAKDRAAHELAYELAGRLIKTMHAWSNERGAVDARAVMLAVKILATRVIEQTAIDQRLFNAQDMAEAILNHKYTGTHS